MGFGASASRDRSSSDMFQNTNSNRTSNSTGSSSSTNILDALRNMFQQTNQQQSGSTKATFAPGGQSTLTALGGAAESGGANVNKAAESFGSFDGKVSPYTEDIIKSNNAEADKTFAGRLAQTRAGAYRGGTASNIGKQGQLAADFTNQQAGENARLRQGAYDNAQTLKLGGASGLGSLGSQQQGIGAQLLQLLRGSDVTGSSTGTTTGTDTSSQTGSNQTQTTEQVLEQLIAAITGSQSGTSSKTSGGFSFGGGAG